MSEEAQRERHFHFDGMIGFAEKAIASIAPANEGIAEAGGMTWTQDPESAGTPQTDF